MELTAVAASLAASAHGGQMRHDGRTLYITHPMRVAARLSGSPNEVVAAAWLHDVLEDTKTTVHDMVAAGIPAPVIAAVESLTKRRGEQYTAYLARVKADPIARAVKMADMLDNLTDNPTPKQVVKYATGLLILLDTYPKFDVATEGMPQEVPACQGLWTCGDSRPYPVRYAAMRGGLTVEFRRHNMWLVDSLPSGMRGNWRRVGNLPS
jgi:hypothetical protein